MLKPGLLEKNAGVPADFFSKKSSFFLEEIMKCLIFSEEITRPDSMETSHQQPLPSNLGPD